MADKKVGINVQLKLDSETFSRKVEGLSKSFTPIGIPAEVEVKEKNTSKLDAPGVKLKSVIQDFKQNSIIPKVDHSNLEALNKHLDVKVSHIKLVTREFAQNQITPVVNLEQLNILNQKFSEISNYFANAKLNLDIDNSAIISQVADIKKELQGQRLQINLDTSHIRQQLQQSLKIKQDIQVSSKESSNESRQLEELRNIKSAIKDQKKGFFSNLFVGATESLGANLSKNIRLGIKDVFGTNISKSTRNLVRDGSQIAKEFIFDNEQVKIAAQNLETLLSGKLRKTAYRLGDALVASLENKEGDITSKINSFTQAFTEGVDFGKLGTELSVELQEIKQQVVKSIFSEEVMRRFTAPLSEVIAEYREIALQERAVPLVRERALEISKSTKGKSDMHAPKAISEDTETLFIAVGGYAGARGLSGKTLVSGQMRSSPGVKKDVKAGGSKNEAIWVKNEDSDIPRESLGDAPKKLVALLTSLGKPNLRGYSKDAVEMAAQAVAAIEKSPDLKVKFLGESGGGFAAEEAHQIMKLLGYEQSSSYLAVGTPDFIGSPNKVNNKLLSPDESLGAETSGRYARLGLASRNAQQNIAGVQGHPYENYRNAEIAELMNFLHGSPGTATSETIQGFKSTLQQFKSANKKSLDSRQVEKLYESAFKNLQKIRRFLLEATGETKNELQSIAQEFENVVVSLAPEDRNLSEAKVALYKAQEYLKYLKEQPGVEAALVASKVADELGVLAKNLQKDGSKLVGTSQKQYASTLDEVKNTQASLLDPSIGVKRSPKQIQKIVSQTKKYDISNTSNNSLVSEFKTVVEHFTAIDKSSVSTKQMAAIAESAFENLKLAKEHLENATKETKSDFEQILKAFADIVIDFTPENAELVNQLISRKPASVATKKEEPPLNINAEDLQGRAKSIESGFRQYTTIKKNQIITSQELGDASLIEKEIQDIVKYAATARKELDDIRQQLIAIGKINKGSSNNEASIAKSSITKQVKSLEKELRKAGNAVDLTAAINKEVELLKPQELEIGHNISSAIALGVREQQSKPLLAVENMAQAMLDTVDEVLKIQSPSKEFEERGEDVGLGFSLGIRRSMSQANGELLKLVDQSLVQSSDLIQKVLPPSFADAQARRDERLRATTSPLSFDDAQSRRDERQNKLNLSFANAQVRRDQRLRSTVSPQLLTQSQAELNQIAESVLTRNSQPEILTQSSADIKNQLTQSYSAAQQTSSRGPVASQKNVTGEDVARVNQFNQQIKKSLELLGQTPANGGFFADLNLKIPKLLKNVFELVKGFLAFQVISLAQQQLQQIGVAAFQTSLRFEALEKSLNFAIGGEGTESLAFVRKEVERLSLPLETSIKGFTQLTAAARGTSFEGAKTQRIFTAIAQASRVYNLTAEQTEGALLAVTQMISKGTVQAEELRGQLGERIPGTVQIFARAMGVSTAQLGKLLEGGKVGLDDLSKFADQLAVETSGGVDEATKTAAASLQRLQNSFADLNRKIGDAISPATIAVFDTFAGSLNFVQKNAKVLRAVLITTALAVTVALLPSIFALSSALFTLAATALPVVAAGMLAIVVANPVLVGALTVLTLGLIAAEDGAKALANALNGVSQAQIDAADSDAKLDFKYAEAIKQLNKQIPLTKEQIDLLTKGLDDQAKRGVNTAKTSELLKNQLLNLQAQAEATAAAQDALNKAVLESETAFKKGKGLAEVYKSRGDLSTAQERARGLIADDAVKDREYESEQKHNINMSALNNARMIDIKNQLAESERLQSSGKKGLEAKQEKELREELLTVEKEANQAQINLANKDADRIKEVRDRRIKDFDEAQSILESKQKSGNITEEQLLQDRLAVQQQKGDEQIADIKQRREKLLSVKNPDKEGLEALAVEEAQANVNIKEAQKTAFDQRLALSQKRADQEIAIAQASKSKGLLTETQFNEQQYAIRTTYLDDQLAVLKARSATIGKTDIDGQLEVKAKESQILQQRTEARKAFLDGQLAQLERQQQKATDLTALATKEREIELQKLVNSRVIRQEDVQSETLKVTRSGIEREIELERDKLQQLQSFPKYDDPVEEEGRQTKIRQSRIRTSDLQLQLLQNEKSQQEAVYAAYARAIDRTTQAIANRATIATQSFSKELLANSALEKSLSLQNQLLDAQKNLRSALGGYIDAEFQILQETAKSEREKKKLIEAAANIKLQSARLQAESDRQSLELQIQQTEQAQRRLEVENAIAQIRNRADTAKSQAEFAKVSADPNATKEQIEAARLGVVASTAEGEGLQQQAEFLGGQRATNAQTNQLRRQTQDLQSGANITRAEFEAANAIANKGDRRRALRALQDRARSRVFGTSDQGEASSRLSSFNNANRGQALTPLEQYRANVVQNRVSPALPQIELPKVMPILNTTVSNLGTAVDSLVQLVQQKLSTPATVTIATPINNYFPITPNPKDVAAGNTQSARKELYDLGMLLKRS